MRFHIVTIFPDMFASYLNESIVARAIKNKKISVKFYNPRTYVRGKYRKVWPDGNISAQVDDRPYGGGPGMVMMADPIIRAVGKAISKKGKTKVIIFSPSGTEFTTLYAKKIVKNYTDIVLISGRYEGIDARVKKILKAEDVSIGNYVLTGGELPAMIMIDVISRQIEGVLGNFNSLEESRASASEVYTRPDAYIYKGKSYKVPKVLLEGHHQKIEDWKKAQNLKKPR